MIESIYSFATCIGCIWAVCIINWWCDRKDSPKLTCDFKPQTRLTFEAQCLLCGAKFRHTAFEYAEAKLYDHHFKHHVLEMPK